MQKNRTTFLLIVTLGVIIKLGIHMYSNGNYGFHRDELLHLAVSEHLDWGFMEFPPLIGVFGKVSTTLLGDSVLAVRTFPALAGVLMLLLTVAMVREMKGNNYAVLLVVAAFLAVYSYWRNHTLFQPVAFDQLFWTLSSFLLIKYINTKHKKYLLWIGLSAALGFLNKYTMVFWGVGFVVGLLFYDSAKTYTNKWFWVTALLFLVLVIPNIIWQSQHNWPVFAHLTGLYEVQLNENSRIDFLRGQFFSMNPFNFPIWLLGLWAYFFNKELKQYKPLGILFLVSGLLLFLAKGKGYYFYACYPIVFAAGAVFITEKLNHYKKSFLIYIACIILLVTGLSRLPFLTPILPIEQFVEFAELKRDETGRVEGLTGDYADMFGWEEQVALVDSVYNTLTEEEKSKTILWAENYGEAGAINHLGKKYGLPKSVCKHGSFWLWGAGDTSGEIAISVGNEDGAVDYFYGEKKLIKMVQHPYAIDEEHNIPVYLLRKPKVRLSEYWPQFESRIFE